MDPVFSNLLYVAVCWFRHMRSSVSALKGSLVGWKSWMAGLPTVRYEHSCVALDPLNFDT